MMIGICASHATTTISQKPPPSSAFPHIHQKLTLPIIEIPSKSFYFSSFIQELASLKGSLVETADYRL